ncbi:MAG: TfpX/TfpZ family type IV pilin accessory protein [Betaproteobacteria bacterium]
MTLQSLNRWKAGGLHLVLSTLIAATLAALVVAIWYPAPYFAAMGGANLLRLLIGVDVILGPLITLIVYDPNKPRLKLDLSIIAALQIGALAYGAYVMFDARPVYTVYTGDRFETVPANSIDEASRARAKPEFQSLPLDGPRVVGAHQPHDANERADIAMAAAAGGADIAHRPNLYHSYAEVAVDAGRRARPLTQLVQQSAEASFLVRGFLDRSGRADASVGYLPVRARNEDFAMIVDRKTGEIVGSLRINPW